MNVCAMVFGCDLTAFCQLHALQVVATLKFQSFFPNCTVQHIRTCATHTLGTLLL